MQDFAETAWEASEQPIVLLVEDEVLIRLASGDHLREAGYKVVEAADGEEALALMHAGLTPNVLVSDVRMPGPINGLKLLDLVKERYPRVPALLASSHLPLDDRDYGDIRFLSKPYSPAALIDAVGSLIDAT